MSLVLTLDQVSVPAIKMVTKEIFGDMFSMLVADVAFDSSYPTGGEVLDLSAYFSKTYAVLVPEDTKGYVIKYLKTTDRVVSTGLLKVYYADYDAGADGVLIEVANELDLSALTAVRIIAFGLRK